MVQKQMDGWVMEKLISDRAQSQISNATLRYLVFEQWTCPIIKIKTHLRDNMPQSKKNGQHYCESHWCLSITLSHLCVLSIKQIGNLTPFQYLTGQVPDVSALMHFHFYAFEPLL